MPLDPRVADLLQQECGTIRSVRDPALKWDCAQIKADLGMRGLHQGSAMLLNVDKRCATEYRERGAEYLQRVLDRFGELRLPWTDAEKVDVEALLLGELRQDWDWLLDFRKKELGPQLESQSTGFISAAQNTAHRLIQEELSFRVLREERRRLPLFELLSPPRYVAVLRHYRLANKAFELSQSDTAEVVPEAVLSLEAMAKLAASDSNATLGAALQVLRAGADDAGRHLIGSMEKIWNFSNTAPSIRHGGGTGDEASGPEAQYILGVVTEGIRYLLTFDLG